MITLGVTGGIGSGKSMACAMLAELGARVFNSDHEAKKLMQEWPEVRADLIAQFGTEVFDEAGQLNRAYLAGQVFSDSAKLNQLNKIVHPRVREAFEAAKEQARKDGVSLLVKEAALIFETGADRFLDAVAVIHAEEDVRIQRVMARDDVTAEQVRARMKHQFSAETLLLSADYVLYNNDDAAALRDKVEGLYDLVMEKENGNQTSV